MRYLANLTSYGWVEEQLYRMHTIASVFGNKPHERPVADTPLDAWLRARDMPRMQFARQLQVTAKTVTYWCQNQVLPDLVNAFRIAQATSGGVLPEHWMGTDLAKFLFTNAVADEDKARQAKRQSNRREYIKRSKRGKATGSP